MTKFVKEKPRVINICFFCAIDLVTGVGGW